MTDSAPLEPTTRWFGESWGAPVCSPDLHIPVPVGMDCVGHEHMHENRSPQIEEGDQGITLPYYGPLGPVRVAYHLDCWLHEIGADRLGRAALGDDRA
jgi:hypothetical protein